MPGCIEAMKSPGRPDLSVFTCSRINHEVLRYVNVICNFIVERGLDSVSAK